MKDLKNMTKTELKVLQEKINLELSQRKDEVEYPILKVVGTEDFNYLLPEHLKNDSESRMLIEAMLDALEEKNRIFNITLQMLPSSDYNSEKDRYYSMYKK